MTYLLAALRFRSVGERAAASLTIDLSAPAADGPAAHSQAGALLACDFFETVTMKGAHLLVLAVIEHATQRIRVLGATPHPTAAWVAQAARNLVMDLEDARSRARFLIRDRDSKFPGLFDMVLEDAGIEIVLSGIQMPRMTRPWNAGCSPAAANCSTGP